MPGVEKSQVYIEFADEGDAACRSCGAQRSVTDKPRPTYQPLSGHDPNGLLYLSGFNPVRQAEMARDSELDELKQQVAALTAALESRAA
jgi:hypothetical protein